MLGLIAPVLVALFRWVVEERTGVIIASALVLHTAWHWMTERGAALGEYDWSLTDPAALAMALRVLMVIVGIWGISWVLKRRRP